MAHSYRGMTLVEIVVAIGVVAIVGAIAIPVTTGFVDSARTNRAIGDIGSVALQITRWRQDHGTYPDSLAAAGIEIPSDPWGRPYVYRPTPHAKTARTASSGMRVNSDFDLYSVGRDGLTTRSLASTISSDDVVRARDGAFIGLARNF